MTEPYALSDDRMYEAVYVTLGKLADAKQGKTVADLETGLPYDKINRALHALIHCGYADKEPGSKLTVSINKKGRAYWKKAASGEITIVPMTSSKKNRKQIVAPPPPIIMHDDVAAAFIKQHSLPVAFNAAMNTCFLSIEQTISDNLSDFTAPKNPKEDFDKHNAKLYSNIQSIIKLCEVRHGPAKSESS